MPETATETAAPRLSRREQSSTVTIACSLPAGHLMQLYDIEEVEVRLSSGEDHRYAAYPNATRDCHWQCEFYPVCGMFDDGSRAEDMLSAIYQVGGQLDRYPELTGDKEMIEVDGDH